jgi:hypothetical protein
MRATNGAKIQKRFCGGYYNHARKLGIILPSTNIYIEEEL